MDHAMDASTVGGTVVHITTYEELRDMEIENYGMGFTEADPNPVVDLEIDEEVLASLLEAIQVPVGAVGGPAASAGANMDIYLPEPNAATAAGLPQPVGDDCHTTAAGMEIILHGQSAHIEFDSPEVNAGLTQPAPNTIGDPGPSTVMGIDILHMPEATTAYLPKATDREILDKIRAAMHLFHTEHIHEAQAKTDPTDLKGTVWYVTSRILGHETNHGCWKGKNCEIVFTADNNEQSSGGLDRYIGLKRTLEFHKEGTKTNWLMHEYIPLDQDTDYLFFKDELVLRKVFRNDKGKGLAAEHNDEINHGSKIASDGKRKRRPSDVWNHFIKIYDKHPRSDGSNLVYGVCRYCDTVLIATTKNGTMSLKRHNTDSCKNSPNKHRQPSSS